MDSGSMSSLSVASTNAICQVGKIDASGVSPPSAHHAYLMHRRRNKYERLRAKARRSLHGITTR